jgi:hypothetical protein
MRRLPPQVPPQPPGKTGPTGPSATGATGPGGNGGLVSGTGTTGPTGTPGSTGPQGTPGAQGTPGTPGEVGPQGSASVVTGPTGAQGAQGSQGSASVVTGPTGAQGSQGSQGSASEVTGPTGAQGSQGSASEVTGPTGAQGSTGPAGSAGVGIQADANNNLFVGTTGVLGESNSIRIINQSAAISQAIAIGSNALDSTTTTTATNIAIGANALTRLTTGSKNIALGDYAGFGYTGAETSNICIGATGIAGESNSIRINNTSTATSQAIAIGSNALDSTTSTTATNIAIGANALTRLTTGSKNIALGDNAGTAFTLGETNNICIGATGIAGESNTIRINNQSSAVSQSIAIGSNALDSVTNPTTALNIAIGANALTRLTGGARNIAVGDFAGIAYTSTEFNNILIGATGVAGEGNSIRINNTSTATSQAIAIGSNALDSTTSTTATNIAVGANALTQLLTGSKNIALGDFAGIGYTGAENNNICIGATGTTGESNSIRINNTSTATSQSIAIGSNALDSTTSTTATNIAVGANALTRLITGSQNIALGDYAGIGYTGAENNNICIGATGILGESNSIRISTRNVATSQTIAIGSTALDSYLARLVNLNLANYATLYTYALVAPTITANATNTLDIQFGKYGSTVGTTGLLTGTQDNANAATALVELTNLKTELAEIRTILPRVTLGATISNYTILPGINYFITGNLTINNYIYFDGQNQPNPKFFITSGGTISVRTSQMFLTNGARSINIFWSAEILQFNPTNENSFYGNYIATTISWVNNLVLQSVYGGRVYGSQAVSTSSLGGYIYGNSNEVAAGTTNIAVGANALTRLTAGYQNIALGDYAGVGYTGAESNNICVGATGVAGENNSIRINNTSTATSQAIAIGCNALDSTTSTTATNIAIGANALTRLTTGVGNIAMGDFAGIGFTGAENNNICIGATGIAGENNAVRIGNVTHLSTTVSTPLLSNGPTITIGTTGTPPQNLRLLDGSTGNTDGKVLTCNSLGNAVWSSLLFPTYKNFSITIVQLNTLSNLGLSVSLPVGIYMVNLHANLQIPSTASRIDANTYFMAYLADSSNVSYCIINASNFFILPLSSTFTTAINSPPNNYSVNRNSESFYATGIYVCLSAQTTVTIYYYFTTTSTFTETALGGQIQFIKLS